MGASDSRFFLCGDDEIVGCVNGRRTRTGHESLQAASATRQPAPEEIHPLLDRQRKPPRDQILELPVALSGEGRQGRATVRSRRPGATFPGRLSRGRPATARGFSTVLLFGHRMIPHADAGDAGDESMPDAG